MRLPKFLGFALVLFAGAACADVVTAPTGRELVYQGKAYPMRAQPLAPWLEANPPREPPYFLDPHASGRGLTERWEIEHGTLWLRELKDRIALTEHVEGLPRPVPSPDPTRCLPEQGYWTCDYTRELFPGPGDIAAEWYSGTIVVPIGDPVPGLPHFLDYDNSRYLVATIRNGRVIRHVELSNDQFMELHRLRFAEFKETAWYREKYTAFHRDFGVSTDVQLAWMYAERYLTLDPQPEDAR